MARIRTVKPEFWTDEKIVQLPFSVRLFFIGLFNFADDYGAIQDKPDQLKLLILPSDDRFDANQSIDLLVACDLIERYYEEGSDETYLTIKNFVKHQKVDRPTKSKIICPDSKKVSIPLMVRRRVAEKYKCPPGGRINNECYFCGIEGSIFWAKLRNGMPSSWVAFSHELSHIVPESSGGETDEKNIVLACRNCNRSMGTLNAFDWLLNGKYHTNQKRDNIETFRENSREFEKISLGREGNGKESIVKEGKVAGEFLNDSIKNLKKQKIEPPPEIIMPFTDAFKLMWQQWKIYKEQEFKFKYKSLQSEQAAIEELATLSKGIEEIAIKIIKQSMAKSWKGFFEIKNNTNGTGNNEKTGSGKVDGQQLDTAFTKFYTTAKSA